MEQEAVLQPVAWLLKITENRRRFDIAGWKTGGVCFVVQTRTWVAQDCARAARIGEYPAETMSKSLPQRRAVLLTRKRVQLHNRRRRHRRRTAEAR